MSFEESLIVHASPTLASIKVSNLYSFTFDSIEDCYRTISKFNAMMNPKGIYIELLKNAGDFYLIYVYRKSQLQSIIRDKNNQTFLEIFGYSALFDLHGYLKVLKKKLCEEKKFPHEIGVFLGYPLEDVKAFIRTEGQNCAVCGEWKAYHDEKSAECMFFKYRHCKEVYLKVYGEGRKLSDMLVSA